VALKGTLPNDVVYRLLWATKSILLVADNVHIFLPPFTTYFFIFTPAPSRCLHFSKFMISLVETTLASFLSLVNMTCTYTHDRACRSS
jgi:hypothetical protein